MASQNASSNYFTIVYYPLEFKDEHLFWKLGTVFESPIHNANQDLHPMCKGMMMMAKDFGYEVKFEKQGKPHIHVLIKTPNKMTEKAFVQKLAMLLDKDLTGVALHQGDALVKDPTTLLRYFYHLDSPMKERFDYTQAFIEVPRTLTKEIVSAFDIEIREDITMGIQTGRYENINQIIFANEYSLVYTEWLYRGRNMYVVNSQFNEIRKAR